MSKPNTSRKGRHHRHPSNRIPAVSDYESDAAAMQSADNYAPPPPTRTNTELNISVLQRYIPSVSTILSVAASAVIYTFNTVGSGWDKAGIEGTMFVCTQTPLPEDPHQRPRACVFVLNRRSLQNLVIDLVRVSEVEVAGELMILQLHGHEGQSDQVLGIWVHNDKAETRDVNAAMITEIWKAVRSTEQPEAPVGEAGPAQRAIGGTMLSMEDLFRSQVNANTAQ